MTTRVLTAHVPVELAEQVDDYAKRLERSRGWIVKQALRDWLEMEDARQKLMREGLEDIESGRLVDSEVIDAWVDGLPDE